jgi:iron complex transport system substrate-binding protein
MVIKKTKKEYGIILFLIIIIQTACVKTIQPPQSILSTTSESSGLTPFVDGSGESLVLSNFPQRIVIAGKQTPMLVDFFYLFPDQEQKTVGFEKRLQTVQDFLRIIDPQAESKMNIDKDAGPEQIAPLEPDLVILKTVMKKNLGDSLKLLGIPVLYVDFENPEQIARDITNMGNVLDQKERAVEINNMFSHWIDDVVSTTGNFSESEKPKVLILQASERGAEIAFDVPPASWLQTQVVELAGGIPVWIESAQIGGWATVGLEQIAAWDADKIIIINYAGNSQENVEEIKRDPTWSNFNAVQAEQIFGFPGDFISWDQPDPRWVLGLKWMAGILHPDVFQFGIDEVKEFYVNFYSLEEDTIENQIFPLLYGSLSGF